MEQPKRRLSAVWFADIVGYTEMSRRDEPAAYALVVVLQTLAREITQQFEGRIVKFIGDSVLAEFSSTDSAVRAAVSIQERYIAEAAARGTESRLRVGVHLGEVTATPDGDLYGDGINTAARLQHEALPGQVIISEDVWRLLRQRPEFRFSSLGAVELRGITTRVEIYDVLFGARAAIAQTASQPVVVAPAAPVQPHALPSKAEPSRSKVNPLWWAALLVPAIGVVVAIVMPRMRGPDAVVTPNESVPAADPATRSVPAIARPETVFVRSDPASATPRTTPAPTPQAADTAATPGTAGTLRDSIRARRDSAGRMAPREFVVVRTFLEGFARSISTELPGPVLARVFPGAPPVVIRGFQQLRARSGEGFSARLARIEPRRMQGDTADLRFVLMIQSSTRNPAPAAFDARIVRGPNGLHFTQLRPAGGRSNE